MDGPTQNHPRVCVCEMKTKALRTKDTHNSNTNIGHLFPKSVMDGNRKHVARQLGMSSKQGSQTDLGEISKVKRHISLNAPHNANASGLPSGLTALLSCHQLLKTCKFSPQMKPETLLYLQISPPANPVYPSC